MENVVFVLDLSHDARVAIGGEIVMKCLCGCECETRLVIGDVVSVPGNVVSIPGTMFDVILDLHLGIGDHPMIELLSETFVEFPEELI